MQQLKPVHYQKRRVFADCALKCIKMIRNFIEKPSSAHFHLDGFVIKQNSRIWGSENPRTVVEKPFHPQCVVRFLDL